MAAADFTKDPDSVLDYQIDWSSWLDTDNSEEIASSDWTVPTGLTEGTGDYISSNTTTTTKIWLSGGTAGTNYDVVNSIVTNSSPAREADRTITIMVRER